MNGKVTFSFSTLLQLIFHDICVLFMVWIKQGDANNFFQAEDK